MKKTTTKKTVAKTATKAESPILKDVKQLYAFMEENDLDTIEYDHKGVYLRLVKTKPAVVPVPVSVGGGITTASSTPAQEQYKEVIKTSLMGIFFRGSTPSAPPFVKEGARVEKGDVICLIEAMKVFNEVRAEFPCIIKKVLVENGRPVKKGDALFAIERV
jgi:biotin carboxyl carrier protein